MSEPKAHLSYSSVSSYFECPYRWSMKWIDRFWSKTEAQPNGCIYWTAALAKGYGRYSMPGHKKLGYSHRIAWELQRGPIPPGMVIDHRCHTEDPTCFGKPCMHARCLNVDHLDVVAQRENMARARARKSHCVNGHEFTPENTAWVRVTERLCRTCKRERDRRAQHNATYTRTSLVLQR